MSKSLLEDLQEIIHAAAAEAEQVGEGAEGPYSREPNCSAWSTSTTPTPTLQGGTVLPMWDTFAEVTFPAPADESKDEAA